VQFICQCSRYGEHELSHEHRRGTRLELVRSRGQSSTRHPRLFHPDAHWQEVSPDATPPTANASTKEAGRVIRALLVLEHAGIRWTQRHLEDNSDSSTDPGQPAGESWQGAGHQRSELLEQALIPLLPTVRPLYQKKWVRMVVTTLDFSHGELFSCRLARDDWDVSGLQTLWRRDDERGVNLRQFAERRRRQVLAVTRPVAMDFLHAGLHGLSFGGVEQRRLVGEAVPGVGDHAACGVVRRPVARLSLRQLTSCCYSREGLFL
jgi:hypothetical protein